MKIWSSQSQLQFKQLQINPKKKFRDFNGIRTHGLCVIAAVRYQLSYEDLYIAGQFVVFFFTRERNETWNDDVNCRDTNLNEDMIVAAVIPI